MNNRLKAWVGFNDGNCDEDTQMLIDDIKELEKKLAEAVRIANNMYHWTLVNYPEESEDYHNDVKDLESLEEKEGDK